ncbi:MAG: hypothetical protein N2449_00115 [Bacteroidales bacterium]|nr:hypothetical protein [Bacteroidales bacterium]
MKSTTAIVIILCLFVACNFNKSIHVSDGLSYMTEGLNVDEIEIKDAEGNTPDLNNLLYGQQIDVIFRNVDGFTVENNEYQPGLRLLIVSASTKDTALYYEDLYENIKSVVKDSTILIGSLTLAKPMRSDQTYNAYLLLWDKKSKNQLKLQFSFSLKSDNRISVSSNKVVYNEIYIADLTNNRVKIDNNFNKENKYAIVFDGLNGFNAVQDSIYCGISIKISDDKGNIYLDEQDLAQNLSFEVNEFYKSISPYFTLGGITESSPFNVECRIWDKKGDASIKVNFSAQVK